MPVSGWRVESQSFLAAQRSDVMVGGRAPVLYCVRSILEASRVAELVKRVLGDM